MDIEIGAVVVLKSGGPSMTVVGIEVGDKPASADCALCGPLPKIVGDDQVAAATITLAQQQWRARHDVHTDNTGGAQISCVWMVDGEVKQETFPIEALMDPNDEDAPGYGYRRHIRRHRRRRFYESSAR